VQQLLLGPRLELEEPEFGQQKEQQLELPQVRPPKLPKLALLLALPLAEIHHPSFLASYPSRTMLML
jgi:hypothetical protein